jgi:hypothetical protein
VPDRRRAAPPKPSNQNVRIDVTIALKGDAKPLTKRCRWSRRTADGAGSRRHRDPVRQ